RVQLTEARADFKILQEQMKVFVNEDLQIMPRYQRIKKESGLIIDTTILSDHPEVLIREEEERVSVRQTNVEKSKLLPDVSVGYSNQSLIGFFSKDNINQQYYGGSTRFHVFSVSLGIPLFNSATKARIRASEMRVEAARKNTAVSSQLIE